jgi:RNA polymerase sigma-70 factor, ECF subfamily
MEMSREDFGLAYEEGRMRTVRFLRSRGAEWDQAMDIAQMAWMRGWERLDQLRDGNLLVTWINTIALNLYFRSLHDERRQVALREPKYANGAINWAAIDLNRILDGCRYSDRTLLEAQLNGLTAKEIAGETGTSETAIRLRLLRARRAARKAADRSPRKISYPQRAHAA